MRHYNAALRAVVLLTALCGIAYPLAVTGVAKLAFPAQANGSLVSSGGRIVGSALLGQSFRDAQGHPLPGYFQPRPLDTGGASNLGPANPELASLIQRRRQEIAAFDGVDPKDVPLDAVTGSGSGLDPDISPAYAYEQVNRIAMARGLDADAVRRLVTDRISDLGEPHVNVLALNQAL